METDATLVRANGVVELNAITDVVLNFTLIIYPCYTESENTVWFNHTFDDFCFFKLWVLVVLVLYSKENFTYSLQIFLFTRMFGLEIG